LLLFFKIATNKSCQKFKGQSRLLATIIFLVIQNMKDAEKYYAKKGVVVQFALACLST
jgi:hypothetical protein